MMNCVHVRGQLFEVWEGFTEESIETGEGQWLVYRRRSLSDPLGKWGAIQGASNAGCRRGRGRKNRLLKSAGERSCRALREVDTEGRGETSEELTWSDVCFREITLVSLGQADGAESKPGSRRWTHLG